MVTNMELGYRARNDDDDDDDERMKEWKKKGKWEHVDDE
jgi:hypothetical protein